MTHRYPATLPATAQESIHDIVHRLEAYLVQREVAHKELERQNAQLSASLQAERQAHEATKAHLKHAAGIVKDLEGKMQPVNEYVAELERQIASLCLSASRPLGYTNEVVLVNRATLHALARLAHVEGTQIEQPSPLWDETRCRVCGWPLAESTDKGCVPGNCSMRPVPKRRADEGYALTNAERRLAESGVRDE